MCVIGGGKGGVASHSDYHQLICRVFVSLLRIGVRVCYRTPLVGMSVDEHSIAHKFAHKECEQQKGYVPNLFHTAKVGVLSRLCNT